MRLLKTLKIEIQTTQGKTSKYFVVEQDCIYENTKLKCAICYSVNLEKTKKRTIEKQVISEKEILQKLSKTYLKTAFACEEDANKIEHIMEYYLQIEIKTDEEKIKKNFEEACTFILCSNDLTLKAEDLLREYKTQISVEKEFQQLKSPHFVNSIYLDTPLV